jgi:RND superfamily putative drug exporter
MNYGHFINYSVSSNSLSNTESGKAQSILSTIAQQNSSLIVVVQPSPGESIAQLANTSLAFQNSLNQRTIPFYESSNSAFSSYANFLNDVLSPEAISTIRDFYANFSSVSALIYYFPSIFLSQWAGDGYSQSSIAQAATASGYSFSNNYESRFITALNDTFGSQSSMNGPARVQSAVGTAALATFGVANPVVSEVLLINDYNVTNYKSSMLATAANLLTRSLGHPLTAQLLQSILAEPQNPGEYYVTTFGLLSAPSVIRQGAVSPDNSTYLITINLNVTESYRGPSNFYPSQNDTFLLRSMVERYFGNEAQVTGQGAIAFDTQNLSSSSGYVFAFTLVFLAIAVAVVLSSYITPFLALIFVSLATALGYVSIYLTGVAVGRVDYTVTYTLTAVILGVATDYFVFIISRYREELRGGKTHGEALHEATSKAGYAIVVSGITVAGSLGALSFISDLRTWGPVLLIAILLTVAMEVTLLPAIVSLIGPRLFLKRTLTRKLQPMSNSSTLAGRKSAFYRAAKFSEKHKFVVIGIMVVLAVPAIHFWFTVPTTYNFNEGLPSSLPSIQAMDTINSKFGSNLIYPIYVIVNFSQSALSSNGTITPQARTVLSSDSGYLVSREGVRTVIGPVIAGNGTGLSPGSARFFFNNGMGAYFLVFTNYDPYSKSAITLVNDLRQNSTLLVGGLTSAVIDLRAYYGSAYTQVEILILIVIAIVLGLSFKSIKYPLISLSGVFISITWTTSILYAVSKYLLQQDLVFLIPVILFVILMSLGNDFTVFIISRVREEQQKFGFEEGLARAMVGSGSVVTALGLILAASLGSLALVPFGFLEQMGIAFVISLVLDTFVIRTLYLPAMITALRRRSTKTQMVPLETQQMS